VSIIILNEISSNLLQKFSGSILVIMGDWGPDPQIKPLNLSPDKRGVAPGELI